MSDIKCYAHASGVCVALRELQQAERMTTFCRWVRDDHDDSWDGDCGIKWMFTTEEGPIQHGVNYCPRCGRSVQPRN